VTLRRKFARKLTVRTTVDGSSGTASPATKKRRSTSVAQIPHVSIKTNTINAQSYTKFRKLPPPVETEAHLNGLIDGVRDASLVNQVVAKLFDHVTVYSSF